MTAETHQVWYATYRPRRFADVAGQEHVITVLRRAVALERIPHALLLSGPRGSGKTSVARIVAMAANCTGRGVGEVWADNAGEPCLQCASCVALANGGSPDVVELDAASNRGIDDVRALRSAVAFTPSMGRYRVYILDEVHELTTAAFDALLKTLEEPPSHCVFVLCTTAGLKIPETVRSRCQCHQFERVPLTAITERLKFIAQEEHMVTGEDVLLAIARQASGSLRDAVGLLEQAALASTDFHVQLEDLPWVAVPVAARALRRLTQLLLARNLKESLELLSRYAELGYDVRWLAREQCEQFRILLRVRVGATAGLGLDGEELVERKTWARVLSVRELGRWIDVWARCATARDDGWGLLGLEMAVVKCLEGV